jgi:hypothetical protein
MKAKKNKRQRSEQMHQVSAGLRDVLGMTQWRKVPVLATSFESGPQRVVMQKSHHACKKMLF